MINLKPKINEIKITNVSEIKRIWCISDTHFGVRANSVEWLKNIEDYFDEYFIPLLKANIKPGDILIHCGDVFDNRQNLNINISLKCKEIFTKISEILPIIMLTGNHDVYQKTTNEINSLKVVFESNPNIYILSEPGYISSEHSIPNSPNCILLPWAFDPEYETYYMNYLGEYFGNKKDNYLFAHFDPGAIKNFYEYDAPDGIENPFQWYKRIFTGHIHTQMDNEKVCILGCPYQMTRSDMGNKKHILLINLETRGEKKIWNEYSPIFKKFNWNEIKGFTDSEYVEIFDNSYVDIFIDSENITNFPYQKMILDNFPGCRALNCQFISNTQNGILDMDYDNENGMYEISLVNLLDRYLTERYTDEEQRNAIYNECIKYFNQN